MKQEKIWRELGSLPPEAQQQVMDYIAFLRLRYAPSRPIKTRHTNLVKESFIGMWRTRKDLGEQHKGKGCARARMDAPRCLIA